MYVSWTVHDKLCWAGHVAWLPEDHQTKVIFSREQEWGRRLRGRLRIVGKLMQRRFNVVNCGSSNIKYICKKDKWRYTWFLNLLQLSWNPNKSCIQKMRFLVWNLHFLCKLTGYCYNTHQSYSIDRKHFTCTLWVLVKQRGAGASTAYIQTLNSRNCKGKLHFDMPIIVT